MSVKNKVSFAIGDGWEGIYLNGKLFFENHHIDHRAVMSLLTALGVDNEEVEADQDALDEEGCFPDTLGG